MKSNKQTENQKQIPPQHQPYPPQHQYQYEESIHHMLLSIVTLISCWCFCFTIPALVYSYKSRDSYRRGQIDDAKCKGKKAKYLAIAAIISVICTVIVVVVLRLTRII